MAPISPGDGVVETYVKLGLALGRHNPGIVDAYYGPPEWKDRADSEPVVPAGELAEDFRHLVARIDGGEDDLSPRRRRWLASQARGLNMVTRVLAGENVAYLDEVEACYGVRPNEVHPDEVAEAHAALDRSLPGSGPLSERVLAIREKLVVPKDRVPEVIEAMSEFLRRETKSKFGLPDGESVDFLLEKDKPYSGFNYYEGNLRSRVAINTDLPLASSSVAHLVAHEAYPGHHTEHCLKEVGLVRNQQHLEETIFLIGTPSCLMAEGLADLALEALLGEEALNVVEPLMSSLGVPFDLDLIKPLTEFSELSGRLRGSLAVDLHDRNHSVEDVIDRAQTELLLDHKRASKAIEFLTDPTWRAYVFCYSEGVRLCRGFAAGSPERFTELLTEQLTPADLVAS